MLCLFGAIAVIFTAYVTVYADEIPRPGPGVGQSGHMMHKMSGGAKHGGKMAEDTRTPLNMPPMMAEHQLANMREHLKGVEAIVGHLGSGNFEMASKTAHEKLGLTPMMRQMCDNMPNETFRAMALEFHKNGDTLGDVLATKDTVRSLKALDDVLATCTACHDMFRQ
jgi:cytochrome c556